MLFLRPAYSTARSIRLSSVNDACRWRSTQTEANSHPRTDRREQRFVRGDHFRVETHETHLETPDQGLGTTTHRFSSSGHKSTFCRGRLTLFRSISFYLAPTPTWHLLVALNRVSVLPHSAGDGARWPAASSARSPRDLGNGAAVGHVWGVRLGGSAAPPRRSSSEAHPRRPLAIFLCRTVDLALTYPIEENAPGWLITQSQAGTFPACLDSEKTTINDSTEDLVECFCITQIWRRLQ
jgi:hypothetical protein